MTPEEIKTMEETLSARREAMRADLKKELEMMERSKESAGSGTAPAAPVAPKSQPFSVDQMDSSALQTMRQQSLGEQFGGVAQAADDIVRTAAGPIGDILEGSGVNPFVPAVLGGVSESTIPESAARSEEAKQRLADVSPAMATGIEVAGQLGQAVALPGGMFATPGKAMLTTGGLGAADTLFGRLQEGKPINENAEEYLASGGMGMASGLGGYHLGKALGGLFGRIVGTDSSVVKVAEKAANINKKLLDTATKGMEESRVVVRNSALAGTVMRLEYSLDDMLFSPKTAPQAWKAMNILRDRANTMADVPLRQLDELRGLINDQLYSTNGLLKSNINKVDLDAMKLIQGSLNKLILDLPKKAGIATGDIKRGVSSWRTMNTYRQRISRTERVSELIANASEAARSGHKAFEQALQDEFKSFTSTPTGRALLKQEFNEGQIKAIEAIAGGDVSRKAFERLDRWVGSTIIAPIFRGLKASYGGVFEAEESRHLARKVIGKVAETGVSQRISPQLGAVAVEEATKEKRFPQSRYVP